MMVVVVMVMGGVVMLIMSTEPGTDSSTCHVIPGGVDRNPGWGPLTTAQRTVRAQ